MKILFYGINYAPEKTGIGKYSGEMCQWMAARGHSIEVITAFPYYPQWKIDQNYNGKIWHTEFIKGVKIRRVPLYVPSKVTGLTRIIHEISFNVSAFFYWFPAFFRSYDLVITVCPVLQSGIYPLLYKWLRNKPYVMHMQDLQLDAAKDLNLVSNKYLLGFLEFIEKLFLRNATWVSSISEGMKKRLLLKGVKQDQYLSLPNWADTDFLQPVSQDLKEELNIEKDVHVVLYSGNIGEKQGLEVVIDCAGLFSEDKKILFLICGEGAAKEKLVKDVKIKGLTNVRFEKLQPYEKMPAFLATADIHLVIQRKSASDLVMPSKLTGILSCGGLAIVTAELGTTLGDVIFENGIGVLSQPENASALKECIDLCLSNDMTEVRKKSREYALRTLDMEKIMVDFEKSLSDYVLSKQNQ